LDRCVHFSRVAIRDKCTVAHKFELHRPKTVIQRTFFAVFLHQPSPQDLGAGKNLMQHYTGVH